MRKYFLGTLFLSIGLAALTGWIGDTNSSAQTLRGERTRILRQGDDAALAAAIKLRTNRTSQGLPERKAAHGGTFIELNERFQNVMLARLDQDGEPVAACVTDLGEANLFFKRDLETGRAIASIDFLEAEREADAKRHGMTVEEFKFYSQMASDFAAMQVASPAGSTVNIVNNDAAGEGFNDTAPAFVVGEGGNTGTTRGAQRLNVFNAAADVWEALLDSSVPINVRAEFNSIPGCSTGGGVLGSAGTYNVHRNFTNAEYASTWYPAALANKRAGADLSPSNPEIVAQFNTDVDTSCLGGGSRFYYGLDNATPSGRINLFVVVLHEIGHGMGFQSFVDGSTGTFLGTPAYPDVYSRHMFDSTLGLHWHEMTDAQRQTSARNTNAVFWNGPSVRSESGFLTGGIQTGTGRVALYTPATFSGGSSISHFSTSAFPNLLMEPAITSGLPLTLDLARQLMRDIGWYRDTTSDNVADAITTVFPSGASVVAGESNQITWVNTGGFGRNVTIEFSTDGGATFNAIASNIPNSGVYSWQVPNTPTSQARIRVRESGYASPSGVSSSNFTILAQPSAAPVRVAGRVTNAQGRMLSNVLVTFRNDLGQIYTDRTSALGNFVINGIPAGRTYIVDVTGKGARFQTRSIEVSGNLAGLELRGN